MEITPGGNGLGAYVRLRDGQAAHRVQLSTTPVITYTSEYGVILGFELQPGNTPDFETLMGILKLDAGSRLALRRQWAELLKVNDQWV